MRITVAAVVLTGGGIVALEALLKGGVAQAISAVTGILGKFGPGFLEGLAELGRFRDKGGVEFAGAEREANSNRLLIAHGNIKLELVATGLLKFLKFAGERFKNRGGV